MGDGVKVALEAMRADAGLWRKQAEAMNAPKNALNGVQLQGEDVGFFAMEQGLDKQLEELRTKVGDLIGKGQEYFNKVGSDLDQAAGQYQQDDESGKQGLNKSQQ